MPLFRYKALDTAGVESTGVHEAPSRDAAIDQLALRKLFVTQLAETGGVKKAGTRFRMPFVPTVSTSDIVLFNRRLATLVASDIPLLESLKTIEGQTENQRFREVLIEVTEDVRQGRAFSDAIARHRDVFPELMVSMVHVGETGGILAAVLEQLADFTEHDSEMRSEVRAALAYPAVVLVLAVGTIIFLMMTVVPRLTEMFTSMRVQLPLPTRILMAVSQGFSTFGIWLLVIVLVGGVGFWQFLKTESGRMKLDSLKLRMPMLGVLVRKALIARFTRSLGALARGGVPIMEGLAVVNRVLNNRVLGASVERIMDRVRRGDSMARGMKNEPLFPEMVRYMISSGEESGHLDQMLLKVADIYDMETRRTVKVLINLLAPLLILIVAAVVGFIAFAMLLPIFQINRMIH